MRIGRHDLVLPSPLVEAHDERLGRHGVGLWLKRDDLIHPELPGNKWRKLKYNVDEAARMGHRALLTFGGAYSNHIRAVAAAGYYFGFATIGVVRGEEHLPLNPTLAYAVERGMRLSYLDRTSYRMKNSPDLVARLRERWGEFYLIPEGGSNELGVRGCLELPGEIGAAYDVICCPVGSGGTLAGVAAGMPPGQRALGFSVLRGGGFLDGDVERLQRQTFGDRIGEWTVECDYHFGGYARTTPQLLEFAADFTARHGVPLDRVYVAKMMYGIVDLARRARFSAGTRIVAVITG